MRVRGAIAQHVGRNANWRDPYDADLGAFARHSFCPVGNLSQSRAFRTGAAEPKIFWLHIRFHGAQMRFTVVTVCRNSEKVLPRALSSLRRQTYQDREWVVIDGLSSDATLNIVRSYTEGIGTLISENDRGIYDAMNKGIRVAKGDIIFFLNSDDAFHDESVLRDVALTFEAYPWLDMLFGNVVYQYPAERVLRTFAHINADTLIFEDLCHQAVFARRSLFDRIGCFDERFLLNADYDWLIRVFRSGARWRRLDRNIAIFSMGGAHMQNPAKLSEERRAVRLQYISPIAMAIGDLRRRVTHRWHRHFRSHPLGRVPLKD